MTWSDARRAVAVLCSLTVMVTSSSCGRSPTSPAITGRAGEATFTSLIVAGPALVQPGETASFTATARYSDGSSQDVTAKAEWWRPVNPSLELTSAGVFLAVHPGEGTAKASFNGRVGSVHVYVLESGTFKLSGHVSEAGGRVLSGVTVEVLSGTGAGLQATTDFHGEYAVYGVSGPVRLRASIDGYTTQIHDVAITAHGATEVFALIPSEVPANIAGEWVMTVAPSPSCRTGLPEIARGRPYDVQLSQQGTSLQMRISGPTLRIFSLAGFTGSVVGSRVRFLFPGDTDYGEWSSPVLYDMITSSETFGFDGLTEGSVTGDEIRTKLNGDLLYWNLAVPAFEPTWYCRATDHVVTLRR